MPASVIPPEGFNVDASADGFPQDITPEVLTEEQVRRRRVVAEQLASLAPGEYPLWIEMRAAELGMPRAPLEKAVKDIIAAKEKARREQKADDERQQRKQAKTKEREFKLVAELPEREREARLDGLAERLGEDTATLRESFTATTRPPVAESLVPWPEAVETAALLSALVEQLKRFVVFRHDTDPIAVALWIMFAWAHDVATHSPTLAATSPDEPDCGKSTLLGVLARLTPRPFSGVELTGPSFYRRVDQDRPTMIVDEADDLFQRKSDLRHAFNAGWSRGTKIPRVVQGVVREFDVFCPKIVALKGMNMPDTTASRSIVIDLWAKLPSEKVEAFLYADAPEFLEIRRKLTRWIADCATALAEANPVQPVDFNNRKSANWKLLFAISDHAGGDWPEQARQAAIQLSRKPSEVSAGRALLEALRRLRAQGGNKESIASAAIVQALTADLDGEWCDYKSRGPITQRQIAALLKNYGIFPRTIHPTGKADASPRGYFWADFDDPFARFLPPDPHIRTQPPKKKRK
jgi:hypothetical protein